MRSTDEQLSEVLNRINKIKGKKTIRRHIITDAVVSVIFAVMITAAAMYIPNVSNTSGTSLPDRYGSLILNTSYIGYVVIAGLAFVLGVFITLLCVHIRQMKNIEREK